MLGDVESHHGLPGASRVIPNGRAFIPATNIRREPLVLAAGRVWDEAKNMARLCDAASDVSWPVCIAGSAHHENSTGAMPSHVRRIDSTAGILGGYRLWEWGDVP